jgi:hypothetical protein
MERARKGATEYRAGVLDDHGAPNLGDAPALDKTTYVRLELLSDAASQSGGRSPRGFADTERFLPRSIRP